MNFGIWLIVIGLILYGLSNLPLEKLRREYRRKTEKSAWAIIIPFIYLKFIRQYDLKNSLFRPFIFYWIIFLVGTLLLIIGIDSLI